MVQRLLYLLTECVWAYSVIFKEYIIIRSKVGD